MKNFLKYFFDFHSISILGVILGFAFYNSQSESNPLSSFITAGNLYGIAFLIVAAIHFILWIFSDKATTYNLKGRLLTLVGDYFFFVASVLCTIGSLFVLNTFVLG